MNRTTLVIGAWFPARRDWSLGLGHRSLLTTGWERARITKKAQPWAVLFDYGRRIRLCRVRAVQSNPYRKAGLEPIGRVLPSTPFLASRLSGRARKWAAARRVAYRFNQISALESRATQTRFPYVGYYRPPRGESINEICPGKVKNRTDFSGDFALATPRVLWPRRGAFSSRTRRENASGKARARERARASEGATFVILSAAQDDDVDSERRGFPALPPVGVVVLVAVLLLPAAALLLVVLRVLVAVDRVVVERVVRATVAAAAFLVAVLGVADDVGQRDGEDRRDRLDGGDVAVGERAARVAEHHDRRQRLPEVRAARREDRLVVQVLQLLRRELVLDRLALEQHEPLARRQRQKPVLHRLGQLLVAGDRVLHVGAELELVLLAGQPDRDVAVPDLPQHPVHRVAEQLLEVVGLLEHLAEALAQAHLVHLLAQLAVRADEVVAQEVHLLADRPADRVQPAHRDPEAAEALLLPGEMRLEAQRALDALEEVLGGEGLGQEVDHAGTDRVDRAAQRRLPGDDHRGGRGVRVVQLGQQAHPVAVGQAHVGHQQVDRFLADDRLGLAEVAGAEDAGAGLAADHVGDQLDQCRLVVDDQHLGACRSARGMYSRRRRRSHSLFPLSRGACVDVWDCRVTGCSFHTLTPIPRHTDTVLTRPL